MPRSRCGSRTAPELPGLRRMPLDRAVAQRPFKLAEGLQVLGGAPSEGERQRPEPRRGQPVEVMPRIVSDLAASEAAGMPPAAERPQTPLAFRQTTPGMREAVL